MVFAQVTFQGPPVDWYALSPLIVLAGGGLVLLVAAALLPKAWPPGAYAWCSAAIAGAAGVLFILLWHKVQSDGPVNLVGGAMSLDGFSVFVGIIVCVSVFLVTLLQDDYLRREGMEGPETY